MYAIGELLLEIYRAAANLPPDEFPEAMMSLVHAVMQFDSARLLSTFLTEETAVVSGCLMFNIPPENARDWEEIQHADLVLPHVLAHRGVPLSFNSPVLFAQPKHAVIRDYATRYGHQNGLVMVLDDPATGHTDGLSFYRKNQDAQFELRDMNIVQVLMPHLQEALRLNRRLVEPLPSARGNLLIAQQDGAIHYCSREAQKLIELEWPRWHKSRLPESLISAIAQPDMPRFNGRHLAAGGKLVGTLLFLRIAPSPTLGRLSPRELEVACLYAEGMSAKRIANTLHIEPTTARNFLQRIYQKLDVHDKASLANLVRQQH